jgi:hypothetical protein
MRTPQSAGERRENKQTQITAAAQIAKRIRASLEEPCPPEPRVGNESVFDGSRSVSNVVCHFPPVSAILLPITGTGQPTDIYVVRTVGMSEQLLVFRDKRWAM